MTVNNLVTTGIAGYVEGVFYHILYNPIIDLKFLVPVVLLFAITMMLRHRVKKTKIDSAPTLEQKREPFTVSQDRFNSEIKKAEKYDMQFYVESLSQDVEKIKQKYDQFKSLRKTYYKYERWSESQNQRKRKKGNEARQELFDEMVKLYSQLKTMKLSVIETKDQER
ncbi:MAG: hypothetical protein ACP5NK_05085 [Thermoplasmata archaeon]